MPSLSSNTYPSLQGRVVFITGGGSGIGAALVRSFAAQGARVAFVDLAGDASAALAEELEPRYPGAVWWQRCDVRDVAALQASIAAAQTHFGDIACLVNNVAHDDRHTLDSVTPEYWEERMAVNQRPAFFAIQAVVPAMKRLGGGSIVNLGSIGWQIKSGGYPCYAIAKSSVNGLTRGLARELGQHGIRINTVTPGWVMTERQLRMWVTAESADEIARNQCLPGPLQPEHIAQMVLYLCSDGAAMCTAQEFTVDGGWS